MGEPIKMCKDGQIQKATSFLQARRWKAAGWELEQYAADGACPVAGDNSEDNNEDNGDGSSSAIPVGDIVGMQAGWATLLIAQGITDSDEFKAHAQSQQSALLLLLGITLATLTSLLANCP